MTFADAEVAREVGDASAVERAGGDAMRGDVCEARDRVDERASGRELGPAAKTGAEAGAFGRGRRLEESPAFGIRDARRTDRSAIHASGGDAHEEESVEPCVART